MSLLPVSSLGLNNVVFLNSTLLEEKSLLYNSLLLELTLPLNEFPLLGSASLLEAILLFRSTVLPEDMSLLCNAALLMKSLSSEKM